MKHKLLFIAFLFVCLAVKSQNVNIISESDINNIKINNTLFSDLKNTLGEKAGVETLLGTAASYNVAVNNSYYQFKFDGLSVDFSNLKAKSYIESFELSNNKNSFLINGKKVSVGDNISTLGDVKISNGRNGAKSILFSTCEDCDVFINIDFNTSDNTITKISYMDMS